MPRQAGTPKTGGRQPGRRNKVTADVKAAAQEFTDEAVRALADIMRGSERDAARVSAIREILDRGWGKPKQTLDVDANITAAVTAIERKIVDGPSDTNS